MADDWTDKTEYDRRLPMAEVKGDTRANETRLTAADLMTLGELQLLQLGLWIIGEEERVDFKLMPTYDVLLQKLKDAADRKVLPFKPPNVTNAGGASTGEQPLVCELCAAKVPHEWQFCRPARPVSGTAPRSGFSVEQVVLDERTGEVGGMVVSGAEESAGPRVEEIAKEIVFKYGVMGHALNYESVRDFLKEKLSIPAAAPSLTPRPTCPKCGGSVVLRHVLSSCPSFCGVQCPKCLPDATWFINSIDDLAQFFSAQEAGQ